jgi:hypothetical protein
MAMAQADASAARSSSPFTVASPRTTPFAATRSCTADSRTGTAALGTEISTGMRSPARVAAGRSGAATAAGCSMPSKAAAAAAEEYSGWFPEQPSDPSGSRITKKPRFRGFLL